MMRAWAWAGLVCLCCTLNPQPDDSFDRATPDGNGGTSNSEANSGNEMPSQGGATSSVGVPGPDGVGNSFDQGLAGAAGSLQAGAAGSANYAGAAISNFAGTQG
jgi:hypothetical protein